MRNTKAPHIALVVAIVAGIGLLVVYATGGQPQFEGLLWFYALGGIAVALIVGARRFLPHDETEEARHPLPSPPEELARLDEDFRRGFDNPNPERRSFLKLLGGAFTALGAALFFPFRSLGPSPGEDLATTAFDRGVRLVTVDGQPVKVDQLKVGEVITTFPEGHTNAADAPTLLIRYDEERFIPLPGREDWVVGGLVAYSKICTHAACAVGLYQNTSGFLLCPCHQSTFDVNNGAKPNFGPATRALPQLPIGVDDEGYVVAMGDYPEPVGPGYWDRSSRL